MHEMGKMKRAQEIRADEVSAQKIIENHETFNRDKRLPLDTWNQSGSQENVFGNLFSAFESNRDHHQKIRPCAPRRERGSVQQATGSRTFFIREDKQSKDTIPMPTFARRPSTMSSIILVEFPKNSMVEDSPHKWRQTNSRHNSNAEICDKAVDNEFYYTSGYAAELRSDSRDSKKPELHFDKFPNPQSFLEWKMENTIQNPSNYLF